jgi:S-adenosylmethionine decarboxylase
LFFEGPEKKVEIVMKGEGPSLRTYTKEFWTEVVKLARAQILSHVSNEYCDAYLLSESSLFVFDRRVLMITCGNTTLAHATLRIVERIGLEKIGTVIYERKNQLFPEYQPSNFYDDVRLLRKLIPGKSYRFGKEDEHHIYLFHLDRGYAPLKGDATLEILMHGIDPESASAFIKGEKHNLEFIRKQTGIHKIFPNFKVDDYLFEPMGYSLNAIRGENYYTVHVTPQPIGSYVSFETNLIENDDIEKPLSRVLEIFKPLSFDVLTFSTEQKLPSVEKLYSLRRKVRSELECGYAVEFGSYYRPTQTVEAAELLEVKD